MLVIVVLVLVVGTVLDLAPTILILSPVLMPVITVAGIDPVYFGIIFVMTCCIGLLTPPVGVVLNVVSGVARVPMGQVIVGVLAVPGGAGLRPVPADRVPRNRPRAAVGCAEATSSTITQGGKTMTILKLTFDHGAGRGARAARHGAGPDRTITVSNGVAETHPVGNGVEAMRACMTERTNGAWTLNAFWSGALGNDLDATQALRSGTQEMVVTSTSPLVGIEPALGVFDLPFLFSERGRGRCHARRRVRHDDVREDGGLGPGQPRLVGERLPQPDELGPAGHEAGGLRGHARPRDAEQHLPRHLPDAGHQRHADGLRRGVHRARDQGDRRAGKPLRHHRHLEVLRGAGATCRTRSTPTRRSWCCSRSRSSTPIRRKSSRSCATAP
jgi:hypothetical protein